MQMAITSGFASFGGESMLDPKTESSGGTMTCKGRKVVAAGDYPDVFPGGCWWLPWCLSWSLLVITLMSFLVAAGDYPGVFPGGCWWLPWCLSWWLLTYVRTHWVKAQLSVVIVSQPDAPIRPPLFPLGKKKGKKTKQKRHTPLWNCLGGLGWGLGCLLLRCFCCWFVLTCYIVSAQSGLPWQRCERRFVAQVALGSPHCVKTQQDSCRRHRAG